MLTIENVIKDPRMLDVKGDVFLRESASTAELPEDFPPVNVMQRDQTMFVHFRWNQTGWLTRLLSKDCAWEARAYLEQIGMGEVPNPTPVKVSFKPGSPANYHAVITLPGSSLPEGAFRLVATLTLNGPAGPTPVAAFEDLGIIQVYED